MSEFKRQLIDEIREHNRSAAPDFLIGFDEPALHNYLLHLKHIRRPRSPKSSWVRSAETTAVVTRYHRSSHRRQPPYRSDASSNVAAVVGG